MRRLLIRPGAIGDCITCMPVMEELRSDYTEVWISSALVPLIRFADRVRPIAQTGLDLLGIHPDAPEALVDAGNVRFNCQLVRCKSAGFCETAMELNSHWRFFPALPPENISEHATDFFARQVGLDRGLKPSIRTRNPSGAKPS